MRISLAFILGISITRIALFIGSPTCLYGQSIEELKAGEEAKGSGITSDPNLSQSQRHDPVTLNHSIDTVDTLNDKGIGFYKGDDYAAALTVFTKVLKAYRADGNKFGEATVLIEIAICYDTLGQKQKALSYVDEAIPKWLEVDDWDNVASSLVRKGDIYRTWGYPEEALRYYASAAPYFSRVGDRDGQSTLLNNTGLSYLLMHEMKKAARYFDDASKVYRSLGELNAEAVALVNLGTAYSQMHDGARAFDALNRALDLARNMRDKCLEAGVLNGFGFAYANLGEEDKARMSYLASLNAYHDIGDIEGDATVRKNLELLDRNASSVKDHP